jgi:hypothetical protein
MVRVLELDLRKVQNYAAKIVPPEFPDQIKMEVDLRGRTVTVFECRPPWRKDIEPEWTRRGVAEMKFDTESSKWMLYWSDSNGRWHIFDLVSPRSIDKMLKRASSSFGKRSKGDPK